MRSPLQRFRVHTSVVLGLLVFAAAAMCESRWESGSTTVPAWMELIGFPLVGLATVGRLWCSLYIAGRKTTELVTEGPYSLSRNPLYVFSLIGFLGTGLCTETFTFTAILLAGFALGYPWVIISEERVLARVHGEAFEAYKQSTPRFWPRFSALREPDTYVVNPIVFRKHVFDALIFIWCVGLLEVFEHLRELGLIPELFRAY